MLLWRVGARIALGLVAAVVFGAAAAGEEIGNETCLACHGLEGFAGADERPLFVAAEPFAASVHGSFPCQMCHRDAIAIPHEDKLKHVGAAACGACHGDAVTAYGKSIHGHAQANGDGDAATCVSCHGSAHEIRKVSDPASPMYPLNLPRTCGVCHGDPDLAKRHGIPVANAYELYMDSIHGRALTRSGLLVAANCSSCHGSHGIRPREDPESTVFRGNVPSTCGGCHAGVEVAYFEGAHGRALKAGNRSAPACVTCHTAHQIARVDTVTWKLQIVSECGTCHEESLATYRDTFHGQVTALGFTRVARCSDCHGSHGVLPASDVRSSVSPANLVTTCRQCHAEANGKFVQFSPHADPHDRDGYPVLYYTDRSMHYLIIGVFAFFGLHTLLWLLRSLLERPKAGDPRARTGGAPEPDEE